MTSWQKHPKQVKLKLCYIIRPNPNLFQTEFGMIRTLRVCGSSNPHLTLRFCANSNEFRQRLGITLGVPAPLASLCNSIFLNARVFFNSVWKSGREGRASSLKEEEAEFKDKQSVSRSFFFCLSSAKGRECTLGIRLGHSARAARA
ncbi:MAG: hypothetical protein AAB470_00020 [Patescibacteria group bacterium]